MYGKLCLRWSCGHHCSQPCHIDSDPIKERAFFCAALDVAQAKLVEAHREQHPDCSLMEVWFEGDDDLAETRVLH